MSQATVEVRFGGRHRLTFECSYLAEGRYWLRVLHPRGEWKMMAAGNSIADVLEEAISAAAKAIAPMEFDYCRFSNPDLA